MQERLKVFARTAARAAQGDQEKFLTLYGRMIVEDCVQACQRARQEVKYARTWDEDQGRLMGMAECEIAIKRAYDIG